MLKHSSNFIRWFGVYVPIASARAALSGLSGLVAFLKLYCARATRRAFTARAHP